MRKFTFIIIGAVAVAILGGAGYLATADFPPPTEVHEKVIPDDRFSR